jgi:hypothetical protein
MPSTTYYESEAFTETGILAQLGDPKVEDADNDGVSDFYDLCDSTPANSVVSASGCPVFSLPPDSFQLRVTQPTCEGVSNGAIEIATNRENEVYTISIDDQTHTLDTAQQNELQLNELETGTYTVCISPQEIPDYQRCYTVAITDPEPLSVSGITNWAEKTLDLQLQGNGPFRITHNKKSFSSPSSSVILNLESGRNAITVKGASDCQGSYSTELFVSEEVRLFPNPTKAFVTLYAGGSDPIVTLTLTDLEGRELMKELFDVPENRELQVRLDHLPQGLYLVSLTSEHIRSLHKLIKQ